MKMKTQQINKLFKQILFKYMNNLNGYQLLLMIIQNIGQFKIKISKMILKD